jgi:membrane protease YdiL (CAAX protease family)
MMPDNPEPSDSSGSPPEPLPRGDPIRPQPLPTPASSSDAPTLHAVPVDPSDPSPVNPAAPREEFPPFSTDSPIDQPAQPQWVVTGPPAPRPPHPGFWGAVLATFVYAVLQLTLGIACAVIAILVLAARSDDPQGFLSRLTRPDFPQSSEFHDIDTLSEALSLAAFCPIGVAVGIALLRFTAGRPWRRRIALCRPGWAHVLLAILGAPALVILSGGAYSLALRAHLPTFHYQAQLEKLIGQFHPAFSILAIGLGPALAEELWFRGLLGRGLVARYGYVGGVLLSSLFFGVLHLDPPHIVATFVMGICLHCAYLATRSLWIPVLLHFLNNSLSVLTATLWKGNEVATSIDEPDAVLYAAALLLGLAVGWAFYRSRARLVAAPAGEGVAWRPDFPGVEYPPAGSDTRVVHPRPGWPTRVTVTVAVLIFAAVVLWPVRWGL